MASFASSATTCGARKHAWTNLNYFKLFVLGYRYRYRISDVVYNHKNLSKCIYALNIFYKLNILHYLSSVVCTCSLVFRKMFLVQKTNYTLFQHIWDTSSEYSET